MNNYYTLKSLVAELRYEIFNKEVREVWSSRKDQIDFYFSSEKTGKLTFVAASPGTALYLDRRAAVPSRNAAFLFPEMQGHTVSGIEMPSAADRYVRVTFSETDLELLFKPFSSRPNVFLIRSGRITGSFKKDAGHAGERAPSIISAAATVAEADELTEIDISLPLKKKIIGIDKRFPRGLINDVADTCNLEAASMPELKEKVEILQQKLLHPQVVSITAEGNLSLLPPEFLSHPPERTFDSVNEGVRTLSLTKNREKRLLPRKKDIERKIGKRISGLQKQLEQFRKEPERLKKADTLEHFGHLLMSQPQSNEQAGDESVTIPDWAEEGRERVIPVTKGETLIDQARRYYEKAARIRKEIAMSGHKKEQLTSQKCEMEELLADLSAIEHPADLEKWIKNNEARLQQAGLAPSGSQPVARPYRLVPLGDYEVWIGKSAKSNDEILSLSHKEDIWMHVRGASGSHVILRNRGNTGWPDPQLVLKVASYAAAYSRQSGSSMVPVIVAKRKHVRKPKGAAPGQVTVTNERVEMVIPQKPEIPDS